MADELPLRLPATPKARQAGSSASGTRPEPRMMPNLRPRNINVKGAVLSLLRGRDEAIRLYREPAEYFCGQYLRVDPRWAMPPGCITEATHRAGIIGPVGRAAILQARHIVDRGYVIIGSPDEIVTQLTESRPTSTSGT